MNGDKNVVSNMLINNNLRQIDWVLVKLQLCGSRKNRMIFCKREGKWSEGREREIKKGRRDQNVRQSESELTKNEHG